MLHWTLLRVAKHAIVMFCTECHPEQWEHNRIHSSKQHYFMPMMANTKWTLSLKTVTDFLYVFDIILTPRFQINSNELSVLKNWPNNVSAIFFFTFVVVSTCSYLFLCCWVSLYRPFNYGSFNAVAASSLLLSSSFDNVRTLRDRVLLLLQSHVSNSRSFRNEKRFIFQGKEDNSV